MAITLVADNHVKTFKTRKGAENYAASLNTGSECQWWKGQKTTYLVFPAATGWQVRAVTHRQDSLAALAAELKVEIESKVDDEGQEFLVVSWGDVSLITDADRLNQLVDMAYGHAAPNTYIYAERALVEHISNVRWEA
jgi:hypothetical protein